MGWQHIIDGVIAAAEENAKQNAREDDYIGDDGLIYCGKCGMPKQKRQEFLGMTAVVPIICVCRDEVLASMEKNKRREQIAMLKSEGFNDRALEKSRFDLDSAPDSKESLVCRDYVEHFDDFYERGKGLVFTGSVGTGKTFYASCIANALMENLHPVLVTSIGRYIRYMEGDYGNRNENIDYLQKFDLVIFDDLGVERNTPYINELVYAVIDGRVRSGKPMIVTTNVTMDELKKTDSIQVESARIYDRILANCIPVQFNGTNRRREQAREEYLEFKKILGI